jgi:hypothetical protein
MPRRDSRSLFRPISVAQPARLSGVTIVFVVAASMLLSSGCYARYREHRRTISFAQFLEAVVEGDIVDGQPVRITPTEVSGVIRSEDGEQTFVASIPPGYDRAELVAELARQGVDVEARY